MAGPVYELQEWNTLTEVKLASARPGSGTTTGRAGTQAIYHEM